MVRKTLDFFIRHSSSTLVSTDEVKSQNSIGSQIEGSLVSPEKKLFKSIFC